MAPRRVSHYTLHAEGGPHGSMRVSVSSAFRALGTYRRLRRALWKVILITDPKGRVTDEAALLRHVTIIGRGDERPVLPKQAGRDS